MQKFLFRRANFCLKYQYKTYRRKIEMKIKTYSQKVSSATLQKAEKSKTAARSTVVALTLGLMASVSPVASAFNGNADAPKEPLGWTIAETTIYNPDFKNQKAHYKNVRTYKKDDDFVAVVDVSGGARIKMMQYGAPKVVNGQKTFWMNTLDYWWDQMLSNSSRVMVVSGQYFDHKVQDRQTPLSYAVQSSGVLVVPSGDPYTDVTKTLKQLSITSGGGVMVADAPDGILKPAGTTFRPANNVPEAIVGRNITDLKSPDSALGRVHLCALTYTPVPPSAIRSKNVLLVYIAKAKTETQMINSLKEWGCHEGNSVAMDGSGTAQMRTKGGNRVLGDTHSNWLEKPGTRQFPQAIGIYNDAN